MPTSTKYFTFKRNVSLFVIQGADEIAQFYADAEEEGRVIPVNVPWPADYYNLKKHSQTTIYHYELREFMVSRGMSVPIMEDEYDRMCDHKEYRKRSMRACINHALNDLVAERKIFQFLVTMIAQLIFKVRESNFDFQQIVLYLRAVLALLQVG